MADVFKILGQVSPVDVNAGGTSGTQFANPYTLYSVPVPSATTVDTVSVGPKAISFPTQSLVSSIIVSEYGGNAPNISIQLSKHDSATGVPEVNNAKQWLFREIPLSANTTRILSLGLTISSGDTIYVYSSVTVTASFTAMGIEVT